MKTATIKFRTTPEWKEALKAKAKAQRQSLSEYIMNACDAKEFNQAPLVSEQKWDKEFDEIRDRIRRGHKAPPLTF